MQLDSQQEAAVQAPLENISVLAGAGSGKTRVIVERINYIIKKYSVSPRNILAITYTRKAANEMRKRIKKRIGPGSQKLTLTTIHGFCFLQLYRFGDQIGWQPETMSIFSENEARQMLNFSLDELGYIKDGKFKRKNDIGKRMIDKAFQHLGSHGEWPENLAIRSIIDNFFQLCREINTLTYNMIISEFLKLLSLRTISDQLRNEYQHIIIDEVQDTTQMQWNIVHAMQPATIFCVGDQRQSIMSFAGSDFNYTLAQTSKFQNHFEIQNNYRSSKSIVTEGNRVMDKYLPMTPKIDKDGRVDTMLSTSESIKDILLHVSKLGYEFKDIALLCRAHRPLKKSVNTLREFGANIYYPKENDSIDNHPHTTIIHAILNLQINPFDLFSFLTIADWRDLSAIQIQMIKIKSKAESMSYNLACIEVICKDLFAENTWAGLNPEITKRIEKNLAENDDDISAYLKWRAIQDLQFNQESVPEDHIQALSIHQSKGLEWPCVILIGASEGILPSSMAKTDEDIEEEKRLYYVAATRAKEIFVISPRINAENSRFINAIN